MLTVLSDFVITFNLQNSIGYATVYRIIVELASRGLVSTGPVQVGVARTLQLVSML